MHRCDMKAFGFPQAKPIPETLVMQKTRQGLSNQFRDPGGMIFTLAAPKAIEQECPRDISKPHFCFVEQFAASSSKSPQEN